jgi:hypothetical protein
LVQNDVAIGDFEVALADLVVVVVDVVHDEHIWVRIVDVGFLRINAAHAFFKAATLLLPS